MAPTLHEFLTANKNFFDLACIFVVGLVFRRKGLLRKKEVDALSRLCFNVCGAASRGRGAPLARRALRRCFPALLFASIVETEIDGALWLVPCASFPFHALYAALVLAAAPRCFAEDDENFMGILLSCLGQNYGLVYPLILGTSLRDTNAFAAVVLFDLAGNAILILIFNDFLAARRAPRRENDEAENPMKPSDEPEAPVEDPDRGDAHAMSMLALPPRRLRALPKTLRNTLARLASSPPLVGELLGIACQLLPVRVPGPVVGFAQWVGHSVKRQECFFA